MNTATIKTYAYGLAEIKAYLFAALFIAGNLILPQLCHLLPQGGLVWLPIYFFTLIAAYKYGFSVGLLTAVLSPLANHWLFGMPVAGMLPIILTKSVLLAAAASFISKKTGGVSLFALLVAIIFYQIAGTLVEWAIVKDFYVAVQDFRLGVPGMLFQLLGGYGLLRLIANK
ncbi:MAG: ECF transporter S component [Candidatus Azobacteroides sp.]|nr:ECF transporter S component [Candidatus Azobacteroides sp.]